MYRLVFDNYLDHLMRHRGASRRQAVLWYPDREMAEQAARRMRALGQAVSIEKLGDALGTARIGVGELAVSADAAGPLVAPDD